MTIILLYFSSLSHLLPSFFSCVFHLIRCLFRITTSSHSSIAYTVYYTHTHPPSLSFFPIIFMIIVIVCFILKSKCHKCLLSNHASRVTHTHTHQSVSHPTRWTVDTLMRTHIFLLLLLVVVVVLLLNILLFPHLPSSSSSFFSFLFVWHLRYRTRIIINRNFVVVVRQQYTAFCAPAIFAYCIAWAIETERR